jgi:hypothetical protein
MKENKIKGTVIAIFAMAVLLVGALGYVGYDVYSEVQSNKMSGVYQEGAAYGYEQAIVQVMQTASASCDAMPLTYQNQTVSLVNVACLQQQQ